MRKIKIDQKNTEKFKWQVKKSKTLVKNKYLNVKEHTIVRSDGSRGKYYIMHRNEFICVLPFDNRFFWLVGQYRLTAKSYMWEFVQGGVEKKETLLSAAKRELVEETGFKAKKWTKLGVFHLAQGISDQKGHIYLAEGLEKIQQQIGEEEGEILQLKRVTRAELDKIIKAGEIFDASSLLCYYLFKDNKNYK